jgi:hypothetical protein
MMGSTEGAATETKAEKTVIESTTAEIDEAVDNIVKEVAETLKQGEEKGEEEIDKKSEEKAVEEKPTADDKPKEGDEKSADQDETEGDESEEVEPEQEEKIPAEPEGEEKSPEADAETDELLTRAVRAGMNLKDARSFASQDAEALGRQIDLLESAGKAGKEGDKSDATKKVVEEEDPLAGIPELDPEIVADEIVEVVDALKSVIRKQDQQIKKLSSGDKKSWFDGQVKALNVKNLDATKREKLNDQYDILSAGYAAKGQEVSNEEIFRQATQLVLGDDLKKAADEDKADKLSRRKKVHTNRPTGPAAKPKGTPMEEVAKEIDKEIAKNQ